MASVITQPITQPQTVSAIEQIKDRVLQQVAYRYDIADDLFDAEKRRQRILKDAGSSIVGSAQAKVTKLRGEIIELTRQGKVAKKQVEEIDKISEEIKPTKDNLKEVKKPLNAEIREIKGALDGLDAVVKIGLQNLGLRK